MQVTRPGDPRHLPSRIPVELLGNSEVLGTPQGHAGTPEGLGGSQGLASTCLPAVQAPKQWVRAPRYPRAASAACPPFLVGRGSHKI